MQLSMDRLKNLDYKQFAVDHGEKLVSALVGLFVAWALYSTVWVPYQRNPEELADSTTQTKDKIESAAWPDAAKEKFKPKSELGERVERLLAPVPPPGRPGFTTPMFWWPYRGKEPFRHPAWFPVENLLAD